MTSINRIQVPIPYPVKWVNCYYIPGALPTLIDTGVNSDEGLETIRSAIRAQGGKLRDIRRIIVTHGHMDHVGLAGRIAQISEAEVFLHDWDTLQWANGREEQYSSKQEDFRQFFVEAGIPYGLIDELIELILSRYQNRCSPIAAETTMENGTVFEFDDFALEVIHTPGHSPGSVCLYNKADGSLFSGDTLLPEIISNPTIEKTGSSEHKSLVSHQATLELIAGLGVKTVFPGHGTPFENLKVRIQRIRGHHGRRRKQIRRILERNEASPEKYRGMTQFLVAKELLGTLSGLDIFFGVSSTRGYLDALEEDGLAFRSKEGAEHVYRLAYGGQLMDNRS
ncbi:MAG: MBL fold metallo-hydrolase [Desulfomonilaceae bacterium]